MNNFLQGHRHHDALCFEAVRATETLDQLKKSDGVFSHLNGRKGRGRLEIIFEIGGALIVGIYEGL